MKRLLFLTGFLAVSALAFTAVAEDGTPLWLRHPQDKGQQAVPWPFSLLLRLERLEEIIRQIIRELPGGLGIFVSCFVHLCDL